MKSWEKSGPSHPHTICIEAFVLERCLSYVAATLASAHVTPELWTCLPGLSSDLPCHRSPVCDLDSWLTLLLHFGDYGTALCQKVAPLAFLPVLSAPGSLFLFRAAPALAAPQYGPVAELRLHICTAADSRLGWSQLVEVSLHATALH